MLVLSAGCCYLNAGITMSEEHISFGAVAPALEFMCWIIVLLVPFLRWVNGAAVTDDQFYFQCALAMSALIGAVSLRLYSWRKANP